ncbi:TnsA endonuclease N-terminal domain-containing protein [Photobacterium rosenbergii]|uniref:TnsA endonuclease N-terminal domain-containing protein n=1 Tax=Photobacterium rosenbergii TaxID=294936 RepID=UPI001C99C7E1|nr:TnsA endonuclease N-terminal domain-containing protein [Photobacterium rosenbergii]MBY5946009.1 TnsA endonuclease N-terminal domain-containing protein [Photobacterium rosenbergii]
MFEKTHLTNSYLNDNRAIDDYLIHRIYRYDKVKAITSFPSNKHSKAQLCESTLEKEICLIKDFDSRVVKRLTQPFTIDFGDFRYTPDAITREIDGQEYIEEVKPAYELDKPRVINRLREVERRLLREGIKFRIITDELTSDRLYIANLWQLYRHRSYPHDLSWMQEARSIFGASCLLGNLQEWLHAQNIDIASLYYSIAHQMILCDLHTPFDNRMELSFNA